MKKILLVCVTIITIQGLLFSQSNNDDQNVFHEYYGNVNLEFLQGTYNDPLTINASEIDLGGIMIEDEATVDITYNNDSKSGIIKANGWGVETKFKLTIVNNVIRVDFEEIKPGSNKYTGEIIALNSNMLRIVYFDRISQMQMDEFSKIIE